MKVAVLSFTTQFRTTLRFGRQHNLRSSSGGRSLICSTSKRAPSVLLRQKTSVAALARRGCLIPKMSIPALARELGRPVKWIKGRREHFLTTTQERDQIWDVSIAVDDNGKILGLRGRSPTMRAPTSHRASTALISRPRRSQVPMLSLPLSSTLQ